MGECEGSIGNKCAGTPIKLAVKTKACGLFDTNGRRDHCRTSRKEARPSFLKKEAKNFYFLGRNYRNDI
jgi:hypothetical protein